MFSNLLLKDKMLAQSKLKALADAKINEPKNLK